MNSMLLLAALLHAPEPAREQVIIPQQLPTLGAQADADAIPRLIPNQFLTERELPPRGVAELEWPAPQGPITFVSPGESLADAGNDAFPPIDVRFDAQYDGGVAPPDGVLAVGKTTLVVLINLRIAMYDKSGTLLSGPFSLSSFFNMPPNFGGGFDPLAVYDPFHDRFIVAALGDSGSAQDSRIFVAFSQTGNAAGAWNKYWIDADQGQAGNWADYASIGLDSQAVYFSANMFQRGGGYSNSTLFIYDKADGYAGTPLSNTHIIDVRTSGNASAYRLRPAFVGEVVANNEFYLAHTDSGFGDRLNLWKLTGDRFASPTLSASSVTLPGTFFPIGSARQPGAGGGVSTLGTNVWNAFYRSGALWVSQAVNGAAGLAAWIHRVRVSSTPFVREQTYQVEQSGKDLFFPYVIPDVEDNDFAVFSAYSSTADFVGGRYWNVSATGAIRYNESIVAGTRRNDSGRHGDYFAISTDPNDPNRYWAITSHMTNGTFAGNNRITSVRFEDVPVPGTPSPVPDGRWITGTQVRASKASAGQITVTYDASTCNTPDHHLVWFDLASVSSYTPSSVTCDVGSSGSWTGVPPAGNRAFLIVSNDNASTEGSHGRRSTGIERPSQTTSCGIVQKSTAGSCGP
jgi:hypothetical protein